MSRELNCLRYNWPAKRALAGCAECQQDFYAGLGRCLARTLDLAGFKHCLRLSPGSESCAACAAGFRQDQLGKRCLAEIRSCAEYLPAMPQDSALQCAQCARGYYLDSGLCLAVGKATEYCERYSLSGGRPACSACQPGYFLEGGLCLAHGKVDGCARYSAAQRGVCAECEPGFLPFQLHTVCAEVRAAPFCAELLPDSSGACKACQQGYYLSVDGTCRLIAGTTGCA